MRISALCNGPLSRYTLCAWCEDYFNCDSCNAHYCCHEMNSGISAPISSYILLFPGSICYTMDIYIFLTIYVYIKSIIRTRFVLPYMRIILNSSSLKTESYAQHKQGPTKFTEAIVINYKALWETKTKSPKEVYPSLARSCNGDIN